MDEDPVTDSLKKAGFVSVAGLEDSEIVNAAHKVRFFLNRSPKEIEVTLVASAGTSCSLIDFQC